MFQMWYEDFIRGLVDQQNAAVREQVGVAMQTAPESAEEVDEWFEKYMKKPPLSQNTALYNALFAAKEELKKLLSDKK